MDVPHVRPIRGLGVYVEVGDARDEGEGVMELLIALGIVVVMGIVLWTLIGYPIWNVWASKQQGEADLQQARNEQKIQIAEAQARLDAATLNKQAAIIEAEAVSEQIKRIGEQLTAHDLYLRWQWIKMMEDRDGDETIYVPTEANIPILQATRRKTNFAD